MTDKDFYRKLCEIERIELKKMKIKKILMGSLVILLAVYFYTFCTY